MDFLATFVCLLLSVLDLLIFVRIILSWIPTLDRSNQLVELLYQATDPILMPARRIIPPLGMIDISPMVVLIAIQLFKGLIGCGRGILGF